MPTLALLAKSVSRRANHNQFCLDGSWSTPVGNVPLRQDWCALRRRSVRSV